MVYYMLKNNLIYTNIIDNFNGFLDTGGGMTFLFRHPELSGELNLRYIDEKSLSFLSKNTIVFCGNDYFKNKIYLFDYVNKKFMFIDKIPKNVKTYTMLNKKLNYSLIEVIFEEKNEKFLFDTGATVRRNNKNSAISFLDGTIFDKLKKKYKTMDKYDDDGSSCIIIPKIIIFDTTIKKAKFLRREQNAFKNFMSTQTGINHIGAIGGNILKNFSIIGDFKKKLFFV